MNKKQLEKENAFYRETLNKILQSDYQTAVSLAYNALSNTDSKLEQLFVEHRKKSKICCDETCFCWEVEQWLNE